MIARRSRVLLVLALVLLAWLWLLAPQLWPERMRVLAFLGIVGCAAWAWGRKARAREPGAQPAADAPEATGLEPAMPTVAPAAVVAAPELGAGLAMEHEPGE